jgi:hypothetical protein
VALSQSKRAGTDDEESNHHAVDRITDDKEGFSLCTSLESALEVSVKNLHYLLEYL